MATDQTPRIKVDVEKYRILAGIAKLELSDLTGIPRTSLRRKLSNPGLFTVDELHSLATVLSMPIEAFEVTAA